MSALFELVVRTRAGGVQTLELDAPSAAAATARAIDKGLQVLSCAPGKAPRVGGLDVRRTGHGRFDLASLSQELALLLGAGLSVIESLRTLAAREAVGTRKAALLDVVKHVSEGLPLSAALARNPEQFPPLLVATVSASEQTGDLSTSLQRYAQHQQSVKLLTDKVVGAAVYPMLLLAVGGVVVIFLLGVVVPKFATLIESTRRELPWSSQLLMSWGRLVAENPWQVAAGAAALFLGAGLGLRHLVRTGARAAWIESLPMIGPIIRQFRHAQLYRTTGMLVSGGIPAPRALQLSRDLLGVADRVRLEQAVRQVQEGRSISSALDAVKLADPVATSMLAVGERSGALAEILERIAQFHEAHLARSIDVVSRLFEPALMIVIGLVIGAIVVLMYLPIFDLASSLQ